MSSDRLRIIEVGPRDGLQNEKTLVPTKIKAEFVRNLVAAGCTEIELTSFVSPKWVPQLADSAELIEATRLIPGVRFSALVPNEKGLERALESEVPAIALFTAASEQFVRKNINMSIEESLEGFRRISSAYREAQPNGFIRGYVSTIVECPVSGPVEPSEVARVVRALAEITDEVSLGETIGVATPAEVHRVADVIEHEIDRSKTVWHFHDTRGTAISNVAAMIERGYRAFDSAAGGLGGCPYAPGAGGNLATEDIVYFAERSGLATGLDQVRLAQASIPVLEVLGRGPSAKTQLATLAACS